MANGNQSASGEGAPASRLGDAGRLAVIAGLDLAVHLLLSGRYGHWIDELYFIACGEHLAWGYVDHPPLIAVVARASRFLLGDSLVALRSFPALAAAALVFLSGWIARGLGGGRSAQAIAAVSTCVVPVYALFGNVLTMNSFEPLFWMSCCYLTIRLAKGGDPRLWLAFGAIAGVGLLNKYSMAFFAAALVAGLVLSPQRRLLFNRWFWIGGLLALAIALPNGLWQAAHGWPTLELLENARRYQHQPVTPLEFVWGQVQIIHPVLLPVWMGGLYLLLFHPLGSRFRFLGRAFVLLFVGFLAVQAKNYYLAPAYPMLLAAGGVAIGGPLPKPRPRLAAAVIALLLIGFAPLAPYVLPILPVAAIPRYMELLGMREVRSERRPMGDVPQIFADMLAWEDLVAEVARVYQSLSPEERRHAVIWGGGYGHAGAVDLFGGRYGLPKAISGHQNYYYWRPQGQMAEPIIAVGIPLAALRPWFASVEAAAEVGCDFCMPDRRTTTIHVCRGLRVPMDELWPLAKCWTCDRPAFAKPGAALSVLGHDGSS